MSMGVAGHFKVHRLGSLILEFKVHHFGRGFLVHFLAGSKRLVNGGERRSFQRPSDAVPPRGGVRGTVVPCFVFLFGREAGLSFCACAVGGGISSAEVRS